MAGSWPRAATMESIKLWDVSDGKEAAILAGHRGAVRGIAYSPDGRLIGSASEDGTVRLWDVSAGKELHRLEGHTDWVYRVAFSPDGRRLASASEDGQIKLWDVTSGREVATFKARPAVLTRSRSLPTVAGSPWLDSTRTSEFSTWPPAK